MFAGNVAGGASAGDRPSRVQRRGVEVVGPRRARWRRIGFFGGAAALARPDMIDRAIANVAQSGAEGGSVITWRIDETSIRESNRRDHGEARAWRSRVLTQ